MVLSITATEAAAQMVARFDLPAREAQIPSICRPAGVGLTDPGASGARRTINANSVSQVP